MAQGASTDPEGVADVLWERWGGKIAWDIGAHTGESVPQLINLFDEIQSFEPAYESYEKLQKAYRWISKVQTHEMAISDHDGELITSVREVPVSSGQLVAMDMPYTEYIPGHTSPAESLPWGRELGIRKVKCRTADSAAETLGYPDFMKVDTEGHEAQVMRGATKVLARQTTDVLIEFHTQANYNECALILQRAGYERLLCIRHPHYEPESWLWYQHGWLRAEATHGYAVSQL